MLLWQSSTGNDENRKVKTQRLTVDPFHLETARAQDAIGQGAGILRAGGLVALPTETVYGLGANALDGDAVARIFAAKKRPAWDPVIVHIAEKRMLDELVTEVPDAARKLIDAFWPGPLTLLLPRGSAIPDLVTAGRPLVGIRMPAHPVAFELIYQAGVPVAAPSANVFGHTSPTTAAHVLEDLDGRIDAVIDAGPTEHGLESTVLDPCRSPMVIYRPGAITAAQVRSAAGPVEMFQDVSLLDEPREAMPSPGVGLRHYAPKARLILVEGETSTMAGQIADAASRYSSERLGLMLPGGIAAPTTAAAVFQWGQWHAPDEMARDLYAGLRALDQQGCTVILCPVPPSDGIGAAIADRLRKAARTNGG